MGKKESAFGVDDTVGTPGYILDVIVRTLGPIGFDPCSHPEAIVPCELAILLPEYAPKKSVFARETFYGDGLTFDWDGLGLTWINAPYSRLPEFCEKAAREGDEVVLLVPVRTGNVYWPKGAGLADLEVRLPRVTHRGSKTHAPWHSWLLYYGDRVERARSGLAALGEVRLHPRHTTFRGDPARRWRIGLAAADIDSDEGAPPL